MDESTERIERIAVALDTILNLALQHRRGPWKYVEAYAQQAKKELNDLRSILATRGM